MTTRAMELPDFAELDVPARLRGAVIQWWQPWSVEPFARTIIPRATYFLASKWSDHARQLGATAGFVAFVDRGVIKAFWEFTIDDDGGVEVVGGGLICKVCLQLNADWRGTCAACDQRRHEDRLLTYLHARGGGNREYGTSRDFRIDLFIRSKSPIIIEAKTREPWQGLGQLVRYRRAIPGRAVLAIPASLWDCELQAAAKAIGVSIYVQA